jgi:hypothetical protein
VHDSLGRDSALGIVINLLPILRSCLPPVIDTGIALEHTSEWHLHVAVGAVKAAFQSIIGALVCTNRYFFGV